MESPKIMDTQQLKEQLTRYYEGETSPEEELLLHLALLDEPKESPLKKHLYVIESLMKGAASLQTKKKATILSFRNKITVTVASLVASVAVALLFILPLSEDSKSYANGVPIAQEEVNRHASEAFGMLLSSIEEGASKSNLIEAKLEQTNSILDRSFESIEGLQESGHFVLTSY